MRLICPFYFLSKSYCSRKQGCSYSEALYMPGSEMKEKQGGGRDRPFSIPVSNRLLIILSYYCGYSISSVKVGLSVPMTMIMSLAFHVQKFSGLMDYHIYIVQIQWTILQSTDYF